MVYIAAAAAPPAYLLAEPGMDLQHAKDQLLEEGVAIFARPHNSLVESLAQKKMAIITR